MPVGFCFECPHLLSEAEESAGSEGGEAVQGAGGEGRTRLWSWRMMAGQQPRPTQGPLVNLS